MGLFDASQNKSKAQQIAEAVIQSARQQAQQIAIQYRTSYERIWNTPNVDPKDVIAHLGKDAAQLFYVSVATMDMVGRSAEIKDIPAKYVYAINPDGSITLSDVTDEYGTDEYGTDEYGTDEYR